MLPKWCGQSQYVDASLSSANNFLVFFLYKYQNTPDPTQNLQKTRVQKTPYP